MTHVAEKLAEMFGQQCDCPACKGKKNLKTLEQIREFLRESLRQLEGIVPLAPIPRHLFRTNHGKTVLCVGKPDAEKDYTVVDTETGQVVTIQWDGSPYYTDLGEVITGGVGNLWILVEDLGEIVAVK